MPLLPYLLLLRSDNADYSVVRLSHPPPTWYARGALVSEKVPEAQAQFQSAEMLDYVYTCLGNAGPDLYHPTNWEETERYLASARQSKDWRKLRQNRRVAVLLLDIIGRGEVSILMPETKRAIKLEKGSTYSHSLETKSHYSRHNHSGNDDTCSG